MLAGNGGQHGWANLTLLIFVSGWSRRLRPAACRAIGRRRNWRGGQQGDQLGAALGGYTPQIRIGACEFDEALGQIRLPIPYLDPPLMELLDIIIAKTAS